MAAGHPPDRCQLPLHLQLPYYAVLLKKLLDFVTEEEAQNRGDPTTLSQACDEGRAVLNGWWKKTDEPTSLVIYYEKAEPLSRQHRPGTSPGEKLDRAT
jgi:hypothetical protein